MSMEAWSPRLGIVYEHPEWFAPLFAALEAREVPYDRIDASAHHFDPSVAAGLPWTLVLNRMSPSAYLRGHGQAIVYTREFLRYVEANGIETVNGSAAFALETSKVSQLLLLRQLGLRAPRTRVINHRSQAVAAAEELTYPVVVKPNVGGSGAGMRRFDRPAELAAAVADGTLDLGVDETALVQEFLPVRNGHIVRVEVLDGRVLYAIKVFPKPGGFNLCPADICQTPADERSAAAPAAGLCPIELPKVALRVEAATTPQSVARDVLAIARRARLDLVGVEYLVNDRDGRVYYYDVNSLSNFVSNAPAVVGFDPYELFADYLAERLRGQRIDRDGVPAGARA
jgi:glutathione synthase/RimK-type ligase-like ATP-grasp enzyme